MSIRLEHLSHSYGVGTAYEQVALKDVTFSIEPGEFIGLVGHTGSGKSTLIRHLNGLLRATSGKLLYDGQDANDRKSDAARKLRRSVGVVFQYPEYQLFASTVLEDVCFGPQQRGASLEDAQKLAQGALATFDIGPELYMRSPLELSEGQKRKVAIAGVLAMNPDVIVLDEPTAGLDAIGRRALLDPLRQMNQEQGKTIILSSHNMEEIAAYTRRVLILSAGQVVWDGTTSRAFHEIAMLESYDLASTEAVYLRQELIAHGAVHDLKKLQAITVSGIVRELLDLYGAAAPRQSAAGGAVYG